MLDEAPLHVHEVRSLTEDGRTRLSYSGTALAPETAEDSGPNFAHVEAIKERLSLWPVPAGYRRSAIEVRAVRGSRELTFHVTEEEVPTDRGRHLDTPEEEPCPAPLPSSALTSPTS